MNALLIFAATFAMVFGLGFQSLNVNRGHPKAAFLTSFVIGTGNLVVLKLIPDSGSIFEIAAYLLGGPFGIVASMWVHGKFMRKGNA